MPPHDRLGEVDLAFIDPSDHQRSAAAHALGVEMSVFFRHTRAGHCFDDAAGDGADPGAGRRTGERSGEPAGGHHRPDAGDRQHAEAREQPGPTADHRTDGRTGAGSLGDVGALGDRTVARHDADVVMRQARLQVAHGGGRVVMGVVEKCNGPGHFPVSPLGRQGPDWVAGRRYCATTFPL